MSARGAIEVGTRVEGHVVMVWGEVGRVQLFPLWRGIDFSDVGVFGFSLVRHFLICVWCRPQGRLVACAACLLCVFVFSVILPPFLMWLLQAVSNADEVRRGVEGGMDDVCPSVRVLPASSPPAMRRYALVWGGACGIFGARLV